MSTTFESKYIAPYHKLNKIASFNSKNNYNTFINWVSGEFDLYLQDNSKGLDVFFPEGKFHIENEYVNGNIIANITLESKILEKGFIIFNKIMSVYSLISKNNL